MRLLSWFPPAVADLQVQRLSQVIMIKMTDPRSVSGNYFNQGKNKRLKTKLQSIWLLSYLHIISIDVVRPLYPRYYRQYNPIVVN